MPIYVFVCNKCKAEFESIEKVGTKLTYCPDCGKIAMRHKRPLRNSLIGLHKQVKH